MQNGIDKYARIRPVMDVDRLNEKTVGIVGLGASYDLELALARSGVGRHILLDPDRVDLINIARQGHDHDHIGVPKVEALAERITQVNPDAKVTAIQGDFCAMDDSQIDRVFGSADLLIFATDKFKAQARGNEVALRLGKSALWIGLYEGGVGGEIIFWHREIDACFRCLCEARYKAHAQTAPEQASLDPPSTGASIFDINFVDSIAGMVAIGLLTRGAENRFGKLVDQLGDRNFIQVKIDPAFSVNGQDVVGKHLGIAPDCAGYFAWNTVVRRDPTALWKVCPDCQRFRGHGYPLVGPSGRVRPGKVPASFIVRPDIAKDARVFGA